MTGARATGPLFDLGSVVATPGALVVAEENGVDPMRLLARHRAGDWGTADRRDNERALRSGARLLSEYGEGRARLWVLTEAETDACPACHGYPGECEPELGEWLDGAHYRTDRPARRLTTTILRPEDY